MGGLEENGGKSGCETIGCIKEGTPCKGAGLSLNGMLRYEERITLDSRLRDYESMSLGTTKGHDAEVFSIPANLDAFAGSKSINEDFALTLAFSSVLGITYVHLRTSESQAGSR